MYIGKEAFEAITEREASKRLFQQTVLQADEGCDFDFLVRPRDTPADDA